MRSGAQERPVRGPRERCLGGRCAGWLGALLLCVVLAAAGMPAGGGVIVDGTRIEACHDRAARVRSHAAAGLASEARPGVAGLTAALPRPRPRARTIEAGGLPPPRAPTV